MFNLEKAVESGFSLIEICVVMLILVILTSFIYPNYSETILSAKRNDGKLALLDLALYMDRYFTQYNTYRGVKIITTTSPQGLYKLNILKTSETNFTLMATAQYHDPQCQILSINQNGTPNLIPNASNQKINKCWGLLNPFFQFTT